MENNVLTCQLCFNKITSSKHRENCNICNMFEVKESIITDDFTPMMTYGLGGCTALLMVFFTKDTNEAYKVVFGHNPFKEKILEWFERYYISDYNIVTIIKTPVEYQKKEDKCIGVPKNQEYWITTITKDNCKLILESYSLMRCFFDTTYFNSSLYFKINHGPKYSDSFGRFIDISYI